MISEELQDPFTLAPLALPFGELAFPVDLKRIRMVGAQESRVVEKVWRKLSSNGKVV